LYRFLYSCLFYLAIPLALGRLIYRSLKEPDYRADILHRFGFFRTKQPGEVIWVHAVSAGETIAAVPLINQLLAAGYPCLVTNMTPTGRDRVRTLLGDTVENCYAPYDLPGSLGRFLSVNRPKLMVTIDTELWPNTIAACARRGIPTAIVNGRMAARSAEGYRRFDALSRPMMAALDLIAVQTDAHAQRFLDLGASPAAVHVTGSIKFDGEYSTGHGERLALVRAMVADRSVLLAASTHEGEEAALLATLGSLKAVLANVLLVLAPRHTHRADHVERLCTDAGWQVQRLSRREPLASSTDILLIDLMGELESWFAVARVAFIGGSLVPVGGHNLLEAVRADAAVIMGIHLDNIEDIAQQFIDREAMVVVAGQRELQAQVLALMQNEARNRALVGAAGAVLADNRGSVARSRDLLLGLIRSTHSSG
jgi:3-deoxy-D-manno-octulosonic-acid transferase